VPPSGDFYALLGVTANASEDEIKRAYRKLAREFHPDANPDDPAAEERFKEVTFAYETLRDPERRRRYDMFGPEAARGTGAGAPAGADPFGGGLGNSGLGDLFDAFFGGTNPFGGGARGARSGPRRGEDAEAILDLEFAEAVFGAEKELSVRLPVTCGTCSGSGARPGTTPTTCSGCNGSGEIRRVRQSILGQMVTAGPCPRCGGAGEEITSPCSDCRGEGRRMQDKSLAVEVPAGVDEGSTLRLTARGASGGTGGQSGDLYVHLRVRPDPRFQRRGADVHHELHLAMTQAALGANLAFETLDGTEELVIAPGTQTGRELRLRARGAPHLQARGRGDLIITVVVDAPTELTKAQEDLLRQLADERGELVAPSDTGLFSKIRSAFK
jgi:molecular chaperone DnaJ